MTTDDIQAVQQSATAFAHAVKTKTGEEVFVVWGANSVGTDKMNFGYVTPKGPLGVGMMESAHAYLSHILAKS